LAEDAYANLLRAFENIRDLNIYTYPGGKEHDAQAVTGRLAETLGDANQARAETNCKQLPQIAIHE